MIPLENSGIPLLTISVLISVGRHPFNSVIEHLQKLWIEILSLFSLCNKNAPIFYFHSSWWNSIFCTYKSNFRLRSVQKRTRIQGSWRFFEFTGVIFGRIYWVLINFWGLRCFIGCDLFPGQKLRYSAEDPLQKLKSNDLSIFSY